MKKKIVSALLTATMVCGMSVVPAVGVAAADDTITVGFSQVGLNLTGVQLIQNP